MLHIASLAILIEGILQRRVRSARFNGLMLPRVAEEENTISTAGLAAGKAAVLSYCFTAMAEISIFALPIRPATLTVARAGLGFGISFL